jgi:hypothetical protein
MRAAWISSAGAYVWIGCAMNWAQSAPDLHTGENEGLSHQYSRGLDAEEARVQDTLPYRC